MKNLFFVLVSMIPFVGFFTIRITEVTADSPFTAAQLTILYKGFNLFVSLFEIYLFLFLFNFR